MSGKSIRISCKEIGSHSELLILLVVVEISQEIKQFLLVPSEDSLNLRWLLRVRYKYLRLTSEQ